jgi:hypothetical protein
MAAQGGGGMVEGLTIGHVVSLTPVETYVFSNLSYQIKLAVGTLDGLAWKVDGGRITNIDMDMPDFDGFAARVLAGFEEQCRIIASRSDQPNERVNIGNPKVILATEGDEPFALDVPSGHTAEAVVCIRRDIVPAPNDYKVLVAGYPLYIVDFGLGRPRRIGALEVLDGKIRFRMVDGPPLPDDIASRMQTRLAQLQSAGQPKTVGLPPSLPPSGAAASLSHAGNADATASLVGSLPAAFAESAGYLTVGSASGKAAFEAHVQ